MTTNQYMGAISYYVHTSKKYRTAKTGDRKNYTGSLAFTVYFIHGVQLMHGLRISVRYKHGSKRQWNHTAAEVLQRLRFTVHSFLKNKQKKKQKKDQTPRRNPPRTVGCIAEQRTAPFYQTRGTNTPSHHTTTNNQNDENPCN